MDILQNFVTSDGATGLPAAFLVAVVGLFGALIGSFLNVVIHRVPREESIAFPASHCPSCDAAIRPYDNIPVVSWAVLRGRCRSCRSPISARYPAVELLTALMFGLTYLLHSGLTRAVIWSALTTATAFGSLWLSQHPGTSSMGKLLALSLVCTLAAAVLFQPALMGKPRGANDS